MARLVPIVLAITLAGCSGSSQAPSFRYACNEGYHCPANQQCMLDCCGGPPCSEQFYQPNADVSDGSVSDLVLMPDATPTAAVGCKSGIGFVYTAKIHGCPAGVTSGSQTLAGICANGWAPATTNPFSDAECKALPNGMFFGMGHGLDTVAPHSGSSISCSWTNMGAGYKYAYLFGCGNPGDSTTAGLVFDAPKSCAGFPRAIILQNMDFPGANNWAGRPSNGNYAESDFPGRVYTNAVKDGTLCVTP